MATVDASNACIPPGHPLKVLGCPVPSTTRGESIVVDGSYHKDPKARLLAYCSGRHVVVRDLAGHNHLVYRGHNATVTAVRFSPSGSYIASGDAKGRLRVWAYDHEEHLCKLDIQLLSGPITDIGWDFESKRIVVVGERADSVSDCCKAVQWDTGVSAGQLAQHTRGRAKSCAFRPKRPMRIATGGFDDSRVLFNAGPPFKRVVDGLPKEDVHKKGSVNGLRYSPDGEKIVSAGADKTVALYDGKTMALLCQKDTVHSGSIYSCDWSQDGKSILTASADGTCKILSGDNLSIKKEYKPETHDGKVPLGAMSVGCTYLNGNIPISCTLNGQITMWESGFLPIFENISTITGHRASIAGLALDGWGKAYTADSDSIVVQWELSHGRAIKRMGDGGKEFFHRMHGDAAISGLTFFKGDVYTIGWDDTVRSAFHIKRDPVALPSQPNAICSCKHFMAILTVGGIVLVKDGSAMPLISLNGFTGQCICLDNNGTTLYVGGDDCKIHVYSVENGESIKEKHVIEGHLKPVFAVQLSHDGKKLASADLRDVCVWNVSDYSALVSKGRWCFHTQRITCLAWTANDRFIASGGGDESIFVWSPDKKMKRLSYPFCHRGGITGLRFSDGYTLVSSGADACLNQWDLTDDISKKFGK